jgi:predicted anti-sigma-YlaC factor YlaD
MRGRSRTCERARAWISAELDGELSDFESILLRSHLVRCESCETFKLDAAAFTRTLRKASLETMSTPVIVSRRRSIAFQPFRVPGAAALAALAIASGGLLASLHGGSVLRQPRTGHVGVLDDQDVHQLQRLKPVAALAELKVRRDALAVTASQIPRTTGFQNP